MPKRSRHFFARFAQNIKCWLLALSFFVCLEQRVAPAKEVWGLQGHLLALALHNLSLKILWIMSLHLIAQWLLRLMPLAKERM